MATEIRTRHYSLLNTCKGISLACVCNSEKLTEDTSHAVRTIVCDSEKSRFNVVCKADLSVPEAARRLFVRECLFSQDLFKFC